jgi:hypothetical protein
MKSLIKFLDCGKYYEKVNLEKNPYVLITVTKFDDINKKIIPFFNTYPLQGSKKLDFED